MSSTYSSSLLIQLMGSGEDSNTWGTITNTNWNLIEQAVAGVTTVTMANANYTLTNLNGTSDQARNMVLIINGTTSGAGKQIIAPLVTKFYIISNQTTDGYSINIGASTGAVITVPNGVTVQVYCDGTNFYSAQTGSAGNFLVNGTLTAAGETETGNMTIGGNLAVTGTTTFTGIPSGPTATSGTNTTQLATTAFVQNATSGLGTMSTQNANNVDITGGTITGTYALNTTGNAATATFATTAGNGGVTSVNGKTGAVSVAPTIIFDGSIPYNSTTTFTVDSTRLTIWFINEGNGFGGNSSMYLGVSWGPGSLANTLYFFNSGVDYQVTFAGALMKSMPAGNGSSLQIQPFGNFIGGYGAPSNAECLVMQF